MTVPPGEIAALRRRLDGVSRNVEAATGETRGTTKPEMEKLEEWAEDLKRDLTRENGELEDQIRETKKQARRTGLGDEDRLAEAGRRQEKQRNAKRKNLFEEQDRIAARKDQLLEEIAAKLKQDVTETEVFTIRWKVI